ncbi:MAG TPA: hypothetical protein VLA82_09395, partial [Actinomycetota bacterium]|nr:hypothetical protein [Actinomycetota bacterium]
GPPRAPLGGAARGLEFWCSRGPSAPPRAGGGARRPAALGPAAAIVAVGGLAWFLWGGRDGPIQVLTSRGAVGWAVDSTVGSIVRLVTGEPAIAEANALRVGAIPLWARAASFVALVATQVAIWHDAERDRDREPFGGTSVAAVAALLALAPVSPTLAAAWVVPWVAVAISSDREERRVATLAIGAIALSGILALRGPVDQGTVPTLLALTRNLLWVAVVASWLTRPITRRATLR